MKGSIPVREELPILYRDEHLIAVHKPSGLLVHRTVLDRHETRFAVQILRDQIGQHVFPVHRLDRGTSGVLLFALDGSICRLAAERFASQQVEKTYLAVVRGHPGEAGRIDHPLTRQFDDYEFRPAGVIPVRMGTETRGRAADSAVARQGEDEDEDEDDKVSVPMRTGIGEAQEAATLYRRLATVELPHAVDRYPTSRYALLEVRPLTGRRHQIRRHLKHIAHPIIGDATYGKGRHNRLFQELFGCHRLLLACQELRLEHPVKGKMVTISAPLADDFTTVLNALGWSNSKILGM